VPSLNGRKRKEAAFLDAEEGDLGEACGAGQHAKQAQQQDFIERIGHLGLLRRVCQIGEMPEKTTVSSNA